MAFKSAKLYSDSFLTRKANECCSLFPIASTCSDQMGSSLIDTSLFSSREQWVENAKFDIFVSTSDVLSSLNMLILLLLLLWCCCSCCVDVCNLCQERHTKKLTHTYLFPCQTLNRLSNVFNKCVFGTLVEGSARPCLLLRRSEFESRWCLELVCFKNCLEGQNLNEKEAISVPNQTKFLYQISRSL